MSTTRKTYSIVGEEVQCNGISIARWEQEARRVTSSAALHHQVRRAIESLAGGPVDFAVALPMAEVADDESPLTQSMEPPPPNNPALGDKCPVFIAWFRRNHSPEEFAKRYPFSRRVAKSMEEAMHVAEEPKRMEVTE